jgi:cytochrome c biogenesis protein CcdA
MQFRAVARSLHTAGRGLMRIIGILLIAVGLISLALGGISYTKREKVLDIGPIEATAERQKTIPLPPLLGGLALAGGVVLLIAGSKKR